MKIHALTLAELHEARARGEITLAELLAEHERRERVLALLPRRANRSVRALRSALALGQDRSDDTSD